MKRISFALVIVVGASASAQAVSLDGVVEPLASKARQIVASCGSKIISAKRHTRVRGTGRWSLHASGRAVDISGNPSCIRGQLAGWPGGASNDYGRVGHYHISYAPGGPEWGQRFAHGGRKARRNRVARKDHQRWPSGHPIHHQPWASAGPSPFPASSLPDR